MPQGELNISERPDESYVDSMKSYLSGLWNEAHENWRTADSYYYGTFPLWWEGSNRPQWLRPSRGRAIIDHAVDHLLSHEPKVKRWPLDDSDEAEETANQLEVAMQSIMHQVSLREPSLTWKQAAKNLLLYGYTIVEDAIHTESLRQSRDKPRIRTGESGDDFELRMDVWSNRKRNIMPFRTRAPHPSTILLDPFQKEPSVALKLARRTNQELYELTAGRLQKNGKPKRKDMRVQLWEERQNPFEFNEAIEYWTEYWHALMVNKSFLFVEPNDWKLMPFGHAFAGFGQVITDTGTENGNDVKYLAVGLLDPIMPTLKAHAQAMSGMHNALMQATWRRRLTTMDASELAAQLARGDDIIEVPDLAMVSLEEVNNFSRWMLEAQSGLDKDIEFGTFSRSQAGIRQQGISTVGQQAILDTASGRKFIAPTAQLQHLATNSASHIMQFVDTLDLEIRVEGKTLKPSMIKGDYSNKVTFEVIDPVLQLQLRELGLAELQQGVLSDQSYWEDYAKRENVTEERWRLIAMEIRKLPPVAQKMAVVAARRMGLEELLTEEMEGELAGGQGGQPAGGPAGLIGPDGQPIGSSLGRGSAQQGANQIMGAARNLRQPLTGQVAKPGRTGQNLAG